MTYSIAKCTTSDGNVKRVSCAGDICTDGLRVCALSSSITCRGGAVGPAGSTAGDLTAAATHRAQVRARYEPLPAAARQQVGWA